MPPFQFDGISFCPFDGNVLFFFTLTECSSLRLRSRKNSFGLMELLHLTVWWNVLISVKQKYTSFSVMDCFSLYLTEMYILLSV